MPFAPRNHPIGVFTHKKSNRSNARGDNASLSICDCIQRGRMRRKPSPADCARQAKLVEHLGIVIRNAALEDVALPGICGGFKALYLANRFQSAALAQKL